jgi:hypothetical protein
VTGQAANNSDAGVLADVGLHTVVAIANALAVATPESNEAALVELRRVLAIDPPSLTQLEPKVVAPMTELGSRVNAICTLLIDDRVDDATKLVNAMLGEHSAHPHLALEGGRWRLHHHPADAPLVAMWTAIAAEVFARVIDAERHGRIGRCDAPSCADLFVDTSKNGTRRFCSTTCQNRVKAAAYRRRQRR